MRNDTAREMRNDTTREIEQTQAIHFREMFRKAREEAFRDSEAFEGIIHVIEQLGSYRLGRIATLGGNNGYCDCLTEIAQKSDLASTIPYNWREYHLPISTLYQIVKDARNDAMHSGAFARHLTAHAIELSLILEDALDQEITTQQLCDYMVRNPVCAELWQPISFVRQQMLINSFSYLPVQDKEDKWFLLSDQEVAKYLRNTSNAERKRRMAKSLEEAVKDGGISVCSIEPKLGNDPISGAMDNFNGKPILVVSKRSGETELIGIITAFDLL